MMETLKIHACLLLALLWLGSFGLAVGQPPQSPAPPANPPAAMPGDDRRPEGPPPPPGLREGPPHRRGPGPLGGRPPGITAHLPSRRWDDIDQRLQNFRNSYDADLVRRDALIESLAAERKRLDPSRLDAASVMTQKHIDKRMGELHQLVERMQSTVQETGDLLSGALITRNLWEPSLRRESPNPTSATLQNSQRQERRKVWLEALSRLEREGPEGFARVVLGDRFGVEIVQSLPERLRRPGLALWRREGAGTLSPKRRQLIDNIRQNWQGRIERMEKQHEELRRELLRQERELRQMRLILENVLTEPDAP